MISLKNVSFSYDGKENNGLHNVSLEIPKGQCVLLCGGSGCGKTTITRLINGLIPHFFSGELSGEISVCGLDVTKTDIADISDYVGSVFQNPRTQFFNTDTDSEIVFGLENRALPQEKLKMCLEKTSRELNLSVLRKRNIFELSGGEKQKIAFASVYATESEIFVLDEPSSNLDMGAIEERTEELKEEAYQYSRDVHSKVDSLFKDVLLESVISEYRNASAQMNVSERQLFDGSLVQSIAERGTEIMHCATMLFLGMVDDATTFAESHGGGGGGSDLKWGRDEDEDNRAWALRCMRMASRMMRSTIGKKSKR